MLLRKGERTRNGHGGEESGRSRNQSLAIWCAPVAGAISTEMEVHFNYWRIAGDEEFCRKVRKSGGKVQDFVEIGLMLEDAEQIEQVCIFLPRPVPASAITDCSSYLEQREIAQGIFNEVLTTTAAARYVELNGNSSVFCRVHKFMRRGTEIDPSELKILPAADGTLLSITRQALSQVSLPESSPTSTRAYFRLRVYIEEDAQDAFVHRIPAPDRLFQSGFNEIEYIDFRLNEARTLPDRIETRIRSDQNAVEIKLGKR